MATITPILNTQYASKGTYPLVIRVTQGKKRRLYPCGYKIREDQWNQEKGVCIKHPDRHQINSTISDMVSRAMAYRSDCILHSRPFNVDRVYKEIKAEGALLDFLVEQSTIYRDKGKEGTSIRLDGLINQLRRWGKTTLYSFLEVESLDLFMISEENSANTRFSKFDLLKTQFDKAIAKELTPGPNPFKAYKIARTEVYKTRLTLEELCKLENEPIPRKYWLFRDMFLLSYYCRGIRFENVLTLKKATVREGRIFYKAVKGGKLASVLIGSNLQAILNRWMSSAGEYIFPLLRGEIKDKKEFIYRKGDINVKVNRGLRQIAKRLNIREFTFHAARHSLATHLMRKGMQAPIIQEVLLHHSLSHTQKYLEALDNEFLDNALESVYNK